MKNTICYTVLKSPVGDLLLTAGSAGLRGLWILGEKHCAGIHPSWVEDPSVFAETARQLAEYFAGERKVFELALDVEGTAFQREAWEALRKIPWGETRSYQQQAAAIGRPAAVRAVGTANGRNPVSIIVPCHRVVGANGSLTGYGGGLAAKRWLLEHESGGLLARVGDAD